MTEAWANVLWAVAGAVFGAGVIYGGVRERLKVLERGQDQLRETIDAHRAEATSGINDLRGMLIALLQRPENDRRRISREDQHE